MMSDVVITYKGESTAFDASFAKKLPTGGHYCEDDVHLQYVKPVGVEHVSIVENVGYLNSDGSVHSAGSNKERYTDPIAVSEGDDILLTLRNSTSVTMWCCVAYYNTDGTFRERVELNNAGRTAFDRVVTVPASTGYVAFTYRTYDSIVRNVYKMKLPA